MATCTQLQAWLAEAETALHQVQTGQKVQITTYGSMSVTYTPANVADLRRYVLDLRNQVADCTGAVRSKRRAIGIIPV